ncbi:MAG: AAA family ATPase [Synechococcaceae cyanobacterium]|nr:AAA family ATPase [Synechococcaceae cyanobacterium]
MTLPPTGRDRGDWLAELGLALGEALPRLYGDPQEPLLQELLVLLTGALGEGRLELPLAGPAPEGADAAAWPAGHRRAAAASPLSRDPDGPLVLTERGVAWRRWQQQRQMVLQALLQRVGQPPAWAGGEAAGDGAAGDVGAAGSAATAAGQARLDPQQRLAVAALREHRLVLLEGGPGTGKTSTVRGLLEAVRRQRPAARIQLAAPTGKAAARLRSACDGLVPCTTLHRLLESRGDRFGRHRQRPLELDLLVVDEVSMLDQALLEALLEALPDPCQLVLVGDAAQLPPIAPGSVLQQLQEPAIRRQLGGAAIHLTRVYRNAGAIAAVAAELRAMLDEEPEPLSRLRPRLEALGPADNLAWLEAEPGSLPAPLLERLRRQQRELAELAGRWSAAAAAEATALETRLLAQRDRLLVLSPRRPGRWGVDSLHGLLLGAAAGRSAAEWPSGTPVLCCRNLPDLGLANGDLGVLVGPEQERAGRRLLFAGAEGQALRIHPAQLAGAVEPAFALTVHKAQGSEAEEVIVLLPGGEPRDPRLLYTALTRARQRALLISARGSAGPLPAAAAGECRT